MRWQQLFGDLQAQFEEAEAAAERSEASSRARAEVGAVGLTDRLRGAIGTEISLRCRGAGPVSGSLVEVGPDWLLVREAHGSEVLVALAAVLAASGLGRRTAAPARTGHVRLQLDLRRAVRGLARDRSAVQVVLVDGASLAGTVDRVGADHLDLAEHPLEDPRRAAAVRRVHTIALSGITLLRTAVRAGD